MELQNKNTYIALTLGPIYRTFSQTMRTRMLWGASYLFSYIIRELIYELIENQKVSKESFLLPFADEVLKCHIDNTEYNGAGIFPDRFIFKSSPGDLQKVSNAINVLLKRMAPLMADHLLNAREFYGYYDNKNNLTQDIEKQLHNFYQIYYTEKVIIENENIHSSLFEDLDYAELQQSYLLNSEHNHIMNFLFRISLTKPNTAPNHEIVSFISEDAFKTRKIFSSLIEIATQGLKKLNGAKYEILANQHLRNYKLDPNQLYDERGNYKDEEDNQDGFLQDVKKVFDEDYRNYHKYVAVLYADGDGIGKLLGKIGSNEQKLKFFSKKLIDFCKATSKLMTAYGGSAIYLGGEDIFAFIPVASHRQNNSQNLRTIFNLIKVLDWYFNKLFAQEAIELGIPVPTLSYGFSIAYYKYPLYENMKIAHKLMEEAKNAAKHPIKNTIGIRVEKHSGQFYEAFIEKRHLVSYENITELINDTTKWPKDTDRKFINSITHKLKDVTFWKILKEIGDKPMRLDAFFDNNFNENFFKKEPVCSYIIKLKTLIISIFKDYSEDEDRKKVIYFTLRFIDFINAKDEK